MKSMILAAGFGTRLKPYSLLRPKPLFPVLNIPLVRIILDQLQSSGCSETVINVHHLGSRVEELFGLEDKVILQKENSILGTGGGMRQAASHFGKGPVLVVNGDIFHSVNLNSVIRFHHEKGAVVTLVMHDCPPLNNVSVDNRGRISGFSRLGMLPEGDTRLAYTGIQIVDSSILTRIPENSFFDIISLYKDLVGLGLPILSYKIANHFWSDIGTADDYLGLHKYLLTTEDETLRLPIFPEKQPFLVSDYAHLGKNISFHDWVCIGPKAQIGDNATLSRVIVWDGAVVEEGAVLSDQIIT